MHPQKIGGLVALLLVVPLAIFSADHNLLFVAASSGLMMIFFSRERIDDERVQQLKMKALFASTRAIAPRGRRFLSSRSSFIIISAPCLS